MIVSHEMRREWNEHWEDKLMEIKWKRCIKLYTNEELIIIHYKAGEELGYYYDTWCANRTRYVKYLNKIEREMLKRMAEDAKKNC